ncbi:MAG: cytochrome c [Deltaproteobacteria bacterium]|jgi:mono/diheme cytochrome c family protein
MLKTFHCRWEAMLLILLMISGLFSIAAADELAEGKSLYTAKCQICHGANGKGDGPAAAAMNRKPADFTNPAFWNSDTDKKIKKTVTSGKGMMPAFKLDDEEIKAVADYLAHTFKK